MLKFLETVLFHNIQTWKETVNQILLKESKELDLCSTTTNILRGHRRERRSITIAEYKRGKYVCLNMYNDIFSNILLQMTICNVINWFGVKQALKITIWCRESRAEEQTIGYDVACLTPHHQRSKSLVPGNGEICCLLLLWIVWSKASCIDNNLFLCPGFPASDGNLKACLNSTPSKEQKQLRRRVSQLWKTCQAF